MIKQIRKKSSYLLCVLFLFDFLFVPQTAFAEGNAYLTGITVDGAPVEGFNQDVFTYDVNVDYSASGITVVGIPEDGTATVEVIPPATVGSGLNTFTVTCSAEGKTTLSYTLNITMTAASDAATLSDLTIDGNTVEGFSSETDTYNITVPYSTASVEIGATATDKNASVGGIGTKNLNVGPNTFTVICTAEDGTTTKSYTLNITHLPNTDASLSDLSVGGITVTGFAPDVYTYNVTVPYSTASVTIGAVATDPNASVTGAETKDLVVGLNTFTVVCTAENGATKNSYTLNITKGSSIVTTPEGYVFDKATGTITGYTGVGGDLAIPDIIEGVSVVAIGNNAFKSKSTITRIILPSTIKSIGNNAFQICTNLVSINIPEGVSQISEYTFERCYALSNISLPESLTAINSSAFKNCSSLTNITLPSSIRSISYYAFQSCTKLGSVIIPEGVTRIYADTFKNCSSLVNISLPESLTAINSFAFEYCAQLQSIMIPDNVEYIGSYAFNECSSLVNVTLSSSLETIGSNAFQNCINLVNITLPDNLTDLGGYAFYNCPSLVDISIPDGVTIINQYTFDYCLSLEHVSLGNNTQRIDENAFNRCGNLEEIIIPDSVTTIKSSAFAACVSLSEVFISYNSSLLNIIESYAFGGCSSLTAITLPNNLVTIDTGAFSGCSALINIVIPDSITAISHYLFENCTNLQSVVLPAGITVINDNAFKGCSSLLNIILPEDLERVGRSAFELCTSLETITFNDSIQTIDDRAFCQCSSLQAVVVPDSVTYAGNSVFGNCFELLQASLGDGITVVNESTFFGCTKLTSVYLNDNITQIDINAFRKCSSLTAIDLPDSLVELSDQAFEECSGLTEIIIPQGVVTLSGYAFSYCSSLESIYIPTSVTSISTSTFYMRNANLIIFGEEGSYAQTYANNNSITFIPNILRLDDLTIEAITVPGFSRDIFEYNILLPYSTTTAVIDASVLNPTIDLSGDLGLQGLDVGMNTFIIVCTAMDGVITQEYTLNITREVPGSDASLSSITINDTAIMGFASNTYTYNISVDDLDQIVIGATANDPNADITGAGIKNLVVGLNTFTITCTAEDGVTKQDYILNITSIPAELYSTTYTFDRTDSIITGVDERTTLSAFKSNFINNTAQIMVYHPNGSEVTSGYLSTGMTVKLVESGIVKDSLQVCVAGDVNGDGEIDVSDILFVRAHILQTYTIRGAAAEAAEVSGNGIIDINDILYMRAHILGTYDINDHN